MHLFLKETITHTVLKGLTEILQNLKRGRYAHHYDQNLLFKNITSRKKINTFMFVKFLVAPTPFCFFFFQSFGAGSNNTFLGALQRTKNAQCHVAEIFRGKLTYVWVGCIVKVFHTDDTVPGVMLFLLQLVEKPYIWYSY